MTWGCDLHEPRCHSVHDLDLSFLVPLITLQSLPRRSLKAGQSQEFLDHHKYLETVQEL